MEHTELFKEFLDSRETFLNGYEFQKHTAYDFGRGGGDYFKSAHIYSFDENTMVSIILWSFDEGIGDVYECQYDGRLITTQDNGINNLFDIEEAIFYYLFNEQNSLDDTDYEKYSFLNSEHFTDDEFKEYVEDYSSRFNVGQLIEELKKVNPLFPVDMSFLKHGDNHIQSGDIAHCGVNGPYFYLMSHLDVL